MNAWMLGSLGFLGGQPDYYTHNLDSCTVVKFQVAAHKRDPLPLLQRGFGHDPDGRQEGRAATPTNRSVACT